MLAFGWLTYLGLNARQLRWPLLASGLVWSALGLWKRKHALAALGRSLRLRWAESAVFGSACFLSLVGLLFRVQLFHWANPLNDTMEYVSLATYLQDHSFNAFVSPALDSRDTITWYAHHEVAHGFRMGATWLLALLQSLTGRDALVVSQPLMGLGLLLNLAGIYLLARWAARLGWRPAAGVVLFAAALGSPLQTTVSMGFQGQIFGTAYFVFVLALLSRCLAPKYWTAGIAGVLSLATTAFLSCYHDMAPLLALVALRNVGDPVLARLAGGTRSAFRCLHACHRAWTSRPGQRRMVAVVHRAAEFDRGRGRLEDSLDVDAVSPVCRGDLTPPLLPVSPFLRVTAVVLLLTVLGLAGVACLMRRRRWVILQALAVFALLAVWFLCVRDPFTGHMGHRWSLFKLAKWAYPVVVLLPFVGLAWLRRRLWLPRVAFFVPGCAVVLISLVVAPSGQSDTLIGMMEVRRPEARRVLLLSYIARGGFDSVCFVDPGVESAHFQSLAGYLVRPLPILNGWFGADDYSAGDQDPHFDLNEKTLVITWSEPPFEAPQERLPLKFNRLDVAKPHVYFLENPGGALQTHPDGGLWTPLSEQPAKLHLWTPAPPVPF